MSAMNMGFVYAILAATTWGLVYAIDQKLLESVSPIGLLFFTSIVGLVMTIPLLLFEDTSIRNLFVSGNRQTLLLIILAQTLASLASFFIYSSIKLLGASTASIFEICYPFFVILFSFLLFGGVLRPAFWVGGFFMFIGSMIIVRWS